MKKRILSLVLAFVMVFSLAVPTFAAETKPVADQVKLLEGLGLITGEGSGVTPEFLAKEMTRLTAACSILKMVGKYDEAKVFVPTENFPDAKGLWAEGNNIMGYLLANPSYGFSGDAGNFNPTNAITQPEVLKVMLTQLGFAQDVDFKWEETTTFGVSKGLVSVEGAYNTQSLVQNVYSALTVPNKTTKATIAEELAKDEAKKALLVAAGLIVGENVDLEAVSAEFLNLRQIKVTFNKELKGDDKTAAKNVANYTVNGTKLIAGETTPVPITATATATTSGKDAIITLQGSTWTTAVIHGKTTNSVEYGDFKADKLTSIDRDFPTIVGYTINGPREIELEFSEAVKAEDISVFKLNVGTAKVSASVKTDAYSNFMVLTTGTDIKDGEWTLEVKSEGKTRVADGAGYPVAAQEYKINFVKDTTAPTVEVDAVRVSANKIEVDILFNKNVKLGNLKAKLGHVEGTNGTFVADGDDFYTVTFPTGSAPGTQTIYFVNGATKAKDTWGNVFEDQTLAFDIVLDTEAPTVKSVVAKDSESLVVTFSEEVEKQGSTSGIGANAANFVVKDSKGTTVSVSDVKVDTKNKEKITLTMAKKFTGGVYTVEVKNLQDKSMYKNKLVTVVMSVDTKDKVAPYIKSVTKSSTDNNKYTVVFSEAMDSAVDNKANWKISLDGTGNDVDADKAVVNSTSIAGDGKSVVLDIKVKSGTFTPKTSTFVASVDSVKDLAGNGLRSSKKPADADAEVETVVNGFTALIGTSDSVPTIKANKIRIIDRKTIKVIFEDSLLDGVSKEQFEINNGDITVDGIDHETIDGTDTVITLTLGSKLDGTIADSLKNIEVIGTEIKNQYGYEIVKGGYIGLTSGDVEDKAAPEMVSAAIDENSWTGKDGEDNAKAQQKIEVGFSEELYGPSVADADFTVDGQEITEIELQTAGGKTTVILTLKNVATKITGEVLVTLVGSVQDSVNKNATTENTEITAISKEAFAKLVDAAKATTVSVAVGDSIVPVVKDCTITYVKNDTVIKNDKYVGPGTVKYTITCDLSGQTAKFDLTYSTKIVTP